MQRDDDFVCRLVSIAAEVAGIRGEIAANFEHRIREEFQGDRPYVAGNDWANSVERNGKIVAAVTVNGSGVARMTVAQAARYYDVSRRHIYRLLRKA